MRGNKCPHKPLFPIPDDITLREQIKHLERYRRYIISAVGVEAEKLYGELVEKLEAEIEACKAILEQLKIADYAPSIKITKSGADVTNATGGYAYDLTVEVQPVLENGSIAPNPDGGNFADGGAISLNVNGEVINVELPIGFYTGTVNCISGEVVSVAEVFKNPQFNVHESGVSSSGIRYVRISAKDAATESAMTTHIAINGYTEEDSANLDNNYRYRGTSGAYIYDMDIDLSNPELILEKLEFLVEKDVPENMSVDPVKIPVQKGDNAITCDRGATSVTYAVDTKTYIDEKISELANN